jgi:hypothetical protein
MIRYCIGLLAAVCLVAWVSAQPERLGQPDSATTIPNAQAAGPGDFGPGTSPIMWLGVRACGQYVIWLVFPEHIAVVDQTHHPKDMKEFMNALENSHIPHDERVIACTSESL